MKKNNWWIIGIVALALILLAFGGGMMSNSWGYRGYGMMGGYGGMMGGNGMMGGGYSPLGWLGMGFGMLFMWIIPLGLVALIVFGVVSLTRSNNSPATPASQPTCPNCAKGAQADWSTCPYCGTALK